MSSTYFAPTLRMYYSITVRKVRKCDKMHTTNPYFNMRSPEFIVHFLKLETAVLNL